MSKVIRTSLIALSAALAACSDGVAGRAVTAPDAGPALSVAPADLRGAATADGPFDVAFGPSASSAQMAASTRAATGGRASGHVGLTLGSGFFTNIATEQYSFVAVSTNDAGTPYAAKGQYEIRLTLATGVVQQIHGEVVCMAIVGNAARMVGQLTSVVVDGVPRAINPNRSHNIWNVTDNGEGDGTADTASPMIFFPAAIAPLHCVSDFIPPQFANEEGNVQVQP